MQGLFRKSHILSFAVASVLVCQAATVSQASVQCFSLEFFYDSKSESDTKLKSALEEYAAKRAGLKLYFHDVGNDKDQGIKKRIDTIAEYFLTLPRL